MKFIEAKKQQLIIKSIILLFLVLLNLYLFFPFLVSIIMGAVLAFSLNSVVRLIENKGLNKFSTLNIILLSSILLLFIPTFSFFFRGATLVTHLMNDENTKSQLHILQVKVVEWIEQNAPLVGLHNFSVSDFFSQSIQQMTSFSLQLFTKVISQVPHITLFSLIMIASAYWFLFREQQIKHFFENNIQMQMTNRKKLITVLQNVCRDILLANIFTAFIQACIVTLGSLIFGFNEWFLVFFITFIASFIPLVGAGPIALILAVVQFANQQIPYGVGLLIVTFVAGISDNLIRSYISSSGEVKVPVLFSILSVLGGVYIFGLPGLFLGPLLISLFIGIVPILIDEIMNS